MSTRDEILNLFRSQQGSWLSGQEISTHLNISRAAVWKQIKSLRELGFTIDAKHSQGYRLVDAPDVLIASDIRSGLNSRLVGREIHAVQEIGSTNTRIREMADLGAEEGTVLVADRQSAGRGRLGRRWESPSGVNLYISILLKPRTPVQEAPQLTFLSAVAVAQTFKEICNIPAQVKWPNDILVNGAKISGLLNEMNAETEQINYVILGMGINLNMTTDQFPPELNYPATSALLETGAGVDRTRFLCALLERIDKFYAELIQQGFGPIRKRWEDLCPLVGTHVRVEQPGAVLSGCVNGIDSDGALLLKTQNGAVERILAGDVKPLNNIQGDN